MNHELPHFYLNEDGKRLWVFQLDKSSEVMALGDALNSDKLNSPHKIALIDRDGVIIEKAPQKSYISNIHDLKLIKGVPQAIQYLNDKKILVALVTNQQGIYKKCLTVKQFHQQNLFLQKALNPAFLDAVFFCPHAAPKIGKEEKGCACRKPKQGMLTAAKAYFKISSNNTIMFGDRESDIAAATNAGVKAVYIATQHDEYQETERRIRSNFPEIYLHNKYDNLLEAVKHIF